VYVPRREKYEKENDRYEDKIEKNSLIMFF